ncbi:hypothetical protein [Burkholderia diffusa]|uniref:hypothetical protein n=1 Tax=Burkholderia diffusa TaxID=488732 RepID=UPI00084144C7|nr:hypothetical protein [Burkholderia diffusa]AOI57410.1 hypothetical protein WI26_07225 [Burkholderia diffusa]
MNEINDGGPAFPEVPGECNVYQGKPGMTLRDYFAAKALAGTLADSNVTLQAAQDADILAKGVYRIADAMLRARGAA